MGNFGELKRAYIMEKINNLEDFDREKEIGRKIPTLYKEKYKGIGMRKKATNKPVGELYFIYSV